MAITSASVSVATTATALHSATNYVGHTVAVHVPTGGSTVYVGASDVTTTSGIAVAAGETFSIDTDPNEVLYGIVASGTQAVRVLRHKEHGRR